MRPPRGRRPRLYPHRSPARGPPEPPQARWWSDRAAGPAPLRSGRDPRRRLFRPQGPVRPARGDRAASSTARASRSSRPCTARTSSPGGRRSTATRSGSSPTTAASCSTRSPTRPPSSSCARTRSTRRWCSCRTPRATWSGATYEQRGIIKDGAKMINAVTNSTVPHFTIQMGSSYGAGNYGMCGRAYDPRFLFTWPSVRTAIMGGPQLAGVMSIVGRQAAAASGREVDDVADEAQRRTIEDQIEAESHVFQTSSRRLRRRRDRPARHPHRPRDLPVRRPQRRSARPARLGHVPHVDGDLRTSHLRDEPHRDLADREPRRDRRPHHPDVPGDGDRHRRRLLRRRPRGGVRHRRRCRGADRRRGPGRLATSRADKFIDAAIRTAPTPSTRATASSPRTPRSPRVRRRRPRLRRTAARRDRAMGSKIVAQRT